MRSVVGPVLVACPRHGQTRAQADVDGVVSLAPVEDRPGEWDSRCGSCMAWSRVVALGAAARFITGREFGGFPLA